MYEYFVKNYSDYLIENSKEFLIYLIPGKELYVNFDWYGKERAKAFKVLGTKSINDIEERDYYYTHMVIWDKAYKLLAAGQRFLFNQKGNAKNKEYSYVESYHPNTYEKLKNESFCEIGRTFIMPAFQKRVYLIELIRGFVRIPESKKINIGLGLVSFNHKNLKKECINSFLEILELSKTNSFDLPKGKYLYKSYEETKKFDKKIFLNSEKLKDIEKKLKEIDPNFKMPEVLKPYLKFCQICYESYSIANNYNGVMQLLFSGRSNLISTKQRNFLGFRIDNIKHTKFNIF